MHQIVKLERKENFYFLSEPLKCMSVMSSSFCMQQDQIVEEWQTNEIPLFQMRDLSHPKSFIKAPIIKRVMIKKITGSRNDVYLWEAPPSLVTHGGWNWCFTLVNSKTNTDFHKARSDTLFLAYKEIIDTSEMGNDEMCEEMQTRLLDTSKNCTTFTP